METRAKSSRCLLLNMLSLCGNSSSDGGPNGVQMANRASGGSSVFRFWPCNTLMRPRMSSLCQTKTRKKIRKLFQMNDGMKRYARECHPRRGLRAGDTFGGRGNNKRRNRRQRKKKSVQFFIRPQGKTNRKNEEDAEAPGGSRVNYRAP